MTSSNQTTPTDSTDDASAEPRPPRAEPGDVLHFVQSGLAFAAANSDFNPGVIGERGMELTVTQDLIDANVDRNGGCWLDLLHDPQAQVARWGAVQFAAGAWPEGEIKTEPGTLAHERAAQRARAEAEAIEDPEERRRALKEYRERYPVPSTSRTLTRFS